MSVRYSILMLFVFIGFLNGIAAVIPSLSADSACYKVLSLDSLSDEDLALLDEYKDSFLLDLKEVQSTLIYKKRKAIDTTVALMNRSSHCEIGLNVSGPIVSSGRKIDLTGAVLSPNIMYYHKWGLYAVMGLGFYTDTSITNQSKVSSLFITPGFYRTFFNKWSLGVAYSRNFSFYGLDIQKGLLNNSFSLYNSIDFWHYITLSVNAGASWSSNLRSKKYLLRPETPPKIGFKKVYWSTLTKDAGQGYSANINISLRKDFAFYNIIGAKVFTVTPDINFLFGHDNNTQILSPFRQPGTLVSSDKFFGFLNVEPGVTVNWRIRNLEIFGAFHLAIPFNVYDDDLNKRIKNPKEYHPYGEGGIKYLFRVPSKKERKKRQ